MDASVSSERIFTRDFSLVFLANLASFLGFYLLLPTLPGFVLSIGMTEKEIGLILGVMSLTTVALRPLVGRLADLRGARGLMVAGAAIIAATTLCYHRVEGLAPFLALRVLHGVGWAAFGTAASVMVALIVPERRRGEAMGYFGMSTSAAMAVAPLVGVALVAGAGYTVLFLVSAGLVLLAGAGTLPVGDRRTPAATTARGWHAFLLPAAIFPSIVAGITSITYGSIVAFLPTFAGQLAKQVELAGLSWLPIAPAQLFNPGLFFTVYAIVLVAGRGPLGRLSDRFGRAQVIAPGLLLAAVALAVLALWRSPWTLATVAALYGLAMAAAQPTLMALVTDRAAPSERGAAMGTFTTAFDLGIGLGAIAWGHVVQHAGFPAMYLASAAVSLAGIALLAVGRPPARARVEEAVVEG